MSWPWDMAREDVKWYMDRQARKRAQRNLWEHQKKVLKQGLQWRARDATAAMEQTGIHRLALLGVSPGDSGPSIPVGQFMGNSGSGDSITSRLMSRPSKEEKDLISAELEIKRGQAHAVQLENQKTQMDLKRMKSTGWNAPTGDRVVDWLNSAGAANAGNDTNMNAPQGTGANSPVVMQQKSVTEFGSIGLEAGMEAFEKLKIDMDGFVYVVPADSQDIEENAFIKAIYYPRKAKKWASPQIKKMQRILEQVKPPPKGWMYKFRRASGQFQLIPRKRHQTEEAKRINKRSMKKYKRRIGSKVSPFTPF